MQQPIIKIATIDELEYLFGKNTELTHHKNVTMLGEKFLIRVLQDMGCVFDFTIEREQRGKPYFLYNDKVHFSISDSFDKIAVALGDKKIGVDIEYLRKDKLKLAERFFNPSEVNYLYAVDERQRDEAFTQLWTIKEAYVKMTGTGIAGNFSNIDLSPEKFVLNQNFIKNNHRIQSFYDDVNALFISVCEW